MNLQAWLERLCQMLPDVKQAILLTDISKDFESLLCWPNESRINVDLHTAAKLAFKQNQAVTTTISPEQESADTDSIIAFPLSINGSLFAVVAIQINIKHSQQAVVLQVLRWGESWLELLLKQDSGKSSNPVFDIVNSAREYDNIEARVQATTTRLANVFSCERVIIGLLQGQRVRVKAISHNTSFDPRVALIRYVELTMAETFQQNKFTLVSHNDSAEQQQDNVSHQLLLKSESDSHICSVPLCVSNESIGVILFERKKDQPFDTTTINNIEMLGQLLAPFFMQNVSLHRATASLGNKLLNPIHKLFNIQSKRFKLGLGISATVILFMLLVPGTYTVNAPATIEGRIQRVIVAPYEGYIEDAFFRAGEIVSKGKLIAKMDIKELRLEQQRQQAQKNEYVNQYRSALSQLNKAQALIFKSQVTQADAQLQLINKKLQRAKLISPLDGVIISGDLSRALGAPVKKGDVLFQVAPLDEYRLVVLVNERDIADVDKGLKGELTLKALPDTKLSFYVTKVSPVFEEQAGEISYRVEAMMDKENTSLRPGMQGVAKIDIGKRRFAWIYFHKLFDAIRLWFWSWLP